MEDLFFADDYPLASLRTKNVLRGKMSFSPARQQTTIPGMFPFRKKSVRAPLPDQENFECQLRHALPRWNVESSFPAIFAALRTD